MRVLRANQSILVPQIVCNKPAPFIWEHLW
jgi:hypothetical protein